MRERAETRGPSVAPTLPSPAGGRATTETSRRHRHVPWPIRFATRRRATSRPTSGSARCCAADADETLFGDFEKNERKHPGYGGIAKSAVFDRHREMLAVQQLRSTQRSPVDVYDSRNLTASTTGLNRPVADESFPNPACSRRPSVLKASCSMANRADCGSQPR